MEYSLIETCGRLCVQSLRLNPYSNGILSDPLSESTLRLFFFPHSLHLSSLNQRVNPFRTIISQM